MTNPSEIIQPGGQYPDPTPTKDIDEPTDRPISDVEYHAQMAREYADGTRSWTNLFHPDAATIVIADAMSALAHAAAAWASKVEEDRRA